MQASRLLSSAAAALLLGATLLPAAFAEGSAKPEAQPAAQATADQVRAEFRRAQAAGELEFGAQFQIAETQALKPTTAQAANKTAPAPVAPVAVAATR